mmetsp:Transcript_41678/g.97553  ORF Transcript_41678/g.97553 Transcript_41678/m.97553 type:complete len:102 (+) Transcript_41678:234-539(+)
MSSADDSGCTPSTQNDTVKEGKSRRQLQKMEEVRLRDARVLWEHAVPRPELPKDWCRDLTAAQRPLSNSHDPPKEWTVVVLACRTNDPSQRQPCPSLHLPY